MPPEPRITAFFNEPTNAVSYLVSDPATGTAAVIDPVLDLDLPCGTVSTRSADAVLAAAREQGLRIEWVLETHAHADHLSAAWTIKERTGAKVGIGCGIGEVQKAFAAMLDLKDAKPGGGDFDALFADGERFPLGELEVEVIATPGHTPGCVSYRIADAVFVGDTLFMPDYGTARCDFPGGDARQLYRSIEKLLALPPETRLFLCHDYKAPGRDRFAWQTTVAEQREKNVHVGGGIDEDSFVAMREARDAKLSTPCLLYPAIQVNLRAGRLPPPERDGRVYLKIPVHVED